RSIRNSLLFQECPFAPGPAGQAAGSFPPSFRHLFLHLLPRVGLCCTGQVFFELFVQTFQLLIREFVRHGHVQQPFHLCDQSFIFKFQQAFCKRLPADLQVRHGLSKVIGCPAKHRSISQLDRILPLFLGRSLRAGLSAVAAPPQRVSLHCGGFLRSPPRSRSTSASVRSPLSTGEGERG